MDENDIKNVVSKIPSLEKAFRGTYAADEALPISSKPAFYIVNTAVREQRGAHWLLVYYLGRDKTIFFDSFGTPLYTHSTIHTHVMNLGSEKILEQHQRLQGFGSSVCGQYTIMTAYFINLGIPFISYLNKFSSNVTYNDSLACKFVENIDENILCQPFINKYS